MGLLDLLQKAINEHGSAEILRERLELIRDQAQAVERKVETLTGELAEARQKVEKLEKENTSLRTQIQRFQPGDDLQPETRQILQYFFERGEDMSTSEVSRRFNLQASVAEYHIDELLRRRLITQTIVGSSNDSCYFGLTRDGRSHVMRNRAP